ncbi:MAG: hypothetical protein EHM13_04380 [Acidobacteria bacterium]|nr:MAG: hypothetical protein EHM13_04380 [Acidobacteriota bacterium]
MPKTISLNTPLSDFLARLASFEPTPFPVLSLYLNLQPNDRGRDSYDAFLRKAFDEEMRSFEAGSPERDSFAADVGLIRKYLADELVPSANGLAIFACSGENGFFEAIQLAVPVEEHWLFVSDEPHLYPLARLDDQYPRYAAVLLDTNSARVFVFALGRLEKEQSIQKVKTRRTSEGGWSQARYQRHIENYHAQHAKELAGLLDRVVREEGIDRIVLSGDNAVALPLIRAELPKHLAEKVVDVLSLDVGTPVHAVLEETLEALRRRDATTDREKVGEAIGAWRARGLGVVGPDETLRCLEMGQVEELLISAAPQAVRPGAELPAAPETKTSEDAGETPVPPLGRTDPQSVQAADRLVTKARQTGARITFIEDPRLLESVGGVAALLRFRV